MYFGSVVNLAWVYYDACLKCADRLSKYSLALRSMTPFKRIMVYNVFVFPLFSYLAQYYPIAVSGDASMETVAQLVSQYIVPFRSGFKSFHLIAPKNMIGAPIPLLDIWAYSVMSMADQGTMEDHNGEASVGKIERIKPSMRISKQIKEMTAVFVENDVSDLQVMDGDKTKTFHADDYLGPKKRKLMYDMLVRCQLRDSGSDKDLLRVLRNNRGLTVSVEQLGRLHSYYKVLPSKCPAVVQYFNFLMIYNANVTDQRVRFIRAKQANALATNTPCWLCGTGLDHIKHIMAECSIVSSARSIFGYFIGSRMNQATMPAVDAWHRALLITNQDVGSKLVAASFVFNWSAWYVIRTLYRGRANINYRSAANSIVARAMDYGCVGQVCARQVGAPKAPCVFIAYSI